MATTDYEFTVYIPRRQNATESESCKSGRENSLSSYLAQRRSGLPRCTLTYRRAKHISLYRICTRICTKQRQRRRCAALCDCLNYAWTRLAYNVYCLPYVHALFSCFAAFRKHQQRLDTRRIRNPKLRFLPSRVSSEIPRLSNKPIALTLQSCWMFLVLGCF